MTDILSGQNVPHFMGENYHFSIKKINKYNFFYKFFLMKILWNIVLIFTHF